ncbi:MAG TPA: CAP domain-containing protein [Anaerolineales bacterium]
MLFPASWFRWLMLVILLTGLCLPQASAAARPLAQTSPSELINAVNNLRLSRGLAPLGQESILTQVAQMQADALLATEGQVGHSRPNGMSLTQLLLLLGYPLWGDLSLGGYRSENFIFGYQLTAADAVEAWLGDDPHTNTMLSENRNDIGAGVSISADGMVYLVIETALSTPSRLPQSDAGIYLPGGPGSTPDPGLAVSQYIVPIAISTARPDGNVYHSVQYGQSLSALAVEYNTTVDLLRSSTISAARSSIPINCC